MLAGGKGSRMELPIAKALTTVLGKPQIAYQIDYFLNSKVVSRIVLALGFKADEVVKYVKESYPDKPIEFSIEDEPLGTGGAIKLALKKCNEKYVAVLNADDFTNIDPMIMNETKENTLFVCNPRLPFGLIEENEEGYVSFKEKPLLNDKWVSIGWYVLNKDEFINSSPDKGSVEYDVFPKMKLRMKKHLGFWRPLNSKKSLIELEKEGLPKELA